MCGAVGSKPNNGIGDIMNVKRLVELLTHKDINPEATVRIYEHYESAGVAGAVVGPAEATGILYDGSEVIITDEDQD